MPRSITHAVGMHFFTFNLGPNVSSMLSDELIAELCKEVQTADGFYFETRQSRHHEIQIDEIILDDNTVNIKLVGYTGLSKIHALPKRLYQPSTLAVIRGLANPLQPDAKVIATRLNEIEKVKDALHQYCQEIANALKEEKGVLGKFPKVKPTDEKTALVIDKKEDAIKRQNFLNGIGDVTFRDFFNRIKHLLLIFKEQDVMSLVSEKLTDPAKEFLACVEMLNAAKFYHVNGRPTVYWSGKEDEAQAKADNEPNFVSDSNVPAVTIMIKLGLLLKNDYFKLLGGAASGAFAREARGTVLVYNSRTGKNEGQVYSEGNFHSDNELPFLQTRLGREVAVILISFLDRQAGQWTALKDFNQIDFAVARAKPYPRHNRFGDVLGDAHASVYSMLNIAERSRPFRYKSQHLMTFKIMKTCFAIAKLDKAGDQKANQEKLQKLKQDLKALRILSFWKEITRKGKVEKQKPSAVKATSIKPSA